MGIAGFAGLKSLFGAQDFKQLTKVLSRYKTPCGGVLVQGGEAQIGQSIEFSNNRPTSHWQVLFPHVFRQISGAYTLPSCLSDCNERFMHQAGLAE